MRTNMPGEVFPIYNTNPFPTLTEVGRPAWHIRAGIWTGVLMSAPPPKVWTFNPSVITLVILLITVVGGAGYYIGHQAATIENIQKQADSASRDAATVQNLIGKDEPSPAPKAKEKR